MPLSDLDPELLVLDPNNEVVASDANSAADGKNAWAAFVAPEAGTYSIRVSAESGRGEYVLQAKSMPYVAGRHVFYNNSFWDTATVQNPDFADDTAIAPDKRALLPGEKASFENYTSYVRGINGIMVDIGGPTGTITADDVEFKTGNDDDPAGWTPYLAIPTVTVRPGEGTDGSDRITLIWPDYDPDDPDNTAVAGQWLEVTVLASENTGLEEPEVFCFGNAIGETGNVTDDAIVNVQDILLARANPHRFWDPATIDEPCDFDRDQRVDATDILIARGNQTWSLTALELIDLSGGKKAGDQGPVAQASGVREEGSGIEENRLVWLEWLYEFEDRGVRARKPSGGRDHSAEDSFDRMAWELPR
jgi:hypothetical protein